MVIKLSKKSCLKTAVDSPLYFFSQKTQIINMAITNKRSSLITISQATTSLAYSTETDKTNYAVWSGTDDSDQPGNLLLFINLILWFTNCLSEKMSEL